MDPNQDKRLSRQFTQAVTASDLEEVDQLDVSRPSTPLSFMEPEERERSDEQAVRDIADSMGMKAMFQFLAAALEDHDGSTSIKSFSSQEDLLDNELYDLAPEASNEQPEPQESELTTVSTADHHSEIPEINVDSAPIDIEEELITTQSHDIEPGDQAEASPQNETLIDIDYDADNESDDEMDTTVVAAQGAQPSVDTGAIGTMRSGELNQAVSETSNEVLEVMVEQVHAPHTYLSPEAIVNEVEAVQVASPVEPDDGAYSNFYRFVLSSPNDELSQLKNVFKAAVMNKSKTRVRDKLPSASQFLTTLSLIFEGNYDAFQYERSLRSTRCCEETIECQERVFYFEGIPKSNQLKLPKRKKTKASQNRKKDGKKMSRKQHASASPISIDKKESLLSKVIQNPSVVKSNPDHSFPIDSPIFSKLFDKKIIPRDNDGIRQENSDRNHGSKAYGPCETLQESDEDTTIDECEESEELQCEKTTIVVNNTCSAHGPCEIILKLGKRPTNPYECVASVESEEHQREKTTLTVMQSTDVPDKKITIGYTDSACDSRHENSDKNQDSKANGPLSEITRMKSKELQCEKTTMMANNTYSAHGPCETIPEIDKRTTNPFECVASAESEEHWCEKTTVTVNQIQYTDIPNKKITIGCTAIVTIGCTAIAWDNYCSGHENSDRNLPANGPCETVDSIDECVASMESDERRCEKITADIQAELYETLHYSDLLRFDYESLSLKQDYESLSPEQLPLDYKSLSRDLVLRNPSNCTLKNNAESIMYDNCAVFVQPKGMEPCPCLVFETDYKLSQKKLNFLKSLVSENATGILNEKELEPKPQNIVTVVHNVFEDETHNTRARGPILTNPSIATSLPLETLHLESEELHIHRPLLDVPRVDQDVFVSLIQTRKWQLFPVSHLESSSDEPGAESNEGHRAKIKRKKIGCVPDKRHLLLFVSHHENKNKVKEMYELSDSEKDDNLPSIAQEKTYKTLKYRQQRLTLSRYSHQKLRCTHNASAQLVYMEEDSYSQAEDTMDLDDVVVNLTNSIVPHNTTDQSSIQMNVVGNWKYVGNKCTPVILIIEDANSYVFIPAPASTDTHLKKVQSPKGQLCYVLIKHKESVVSTHIPRRRTNIHVSSACRGVRKTKQVHRVITTSASEISSDYSKSAIVLESYSQRNLFAIKALKTPTNDFVGIPSHEKLSQSNIGLVDQTTTSETSSQEQLSRYISATTVRTDSMRLPTLAAAKSPSVSSLRVPPAMAAESPVKSKGQKGRSLRVQVDGEQKASLLNTVTAASIPQSCSTRTSERNSPRENDSSLQRSIPTRRSPDWIAIATKLLHVPDYQKMIQILNGVTPAQEDVVAHKFIRGIAYFKVGKLRQAMDDLHECEKFALESIEDERRAHSQRQLDSGVFSMQPGSQASPQASSLQYLQQSSKKGDVAVCNVYMGDLHYTSGSYLEASKCYQRAADLYDRECVARLFRMVPPTISTIHSKCGSCLRNLSKSMEAIQEYRNAIETAIRDKDRLAAHTSLGNLQQTLGQNKEALVEYEHALDLAETLNEHMSVGWTHGNIGNAFLGLNEKDKALFHLQKALDITIKYEPKPDSIGRAYNNLGTAYQSMGDLDKAEEHYDLALSQAIYGNDPAGQSRVYGNIGNIYIVRKRFEKAIPHYTEVLRLSKDEATISTAHHNRGCALYEWAESKMLALEQSLQKTSSSKEPIFRFHGSQTTLPQKHSPRIVIDSIAKLFRDGMSDLQKVAETHEAKLDHIKGSAKGLSLSVSLTESNSRTFHRLQDCMVAIGNWREALLIAEQSRARTLGEIMLARKESQLEKALTSPLNLEHVYSIVSSQKSPVLYLTHTGASLFGWVLVPAEDRDSISIEMFEIPISDDQFNGKSFDYHIRYGLTEVLVEQSYEMYRSIDYDEETTAPVAQLFKVIGKPFQMTLDRLLPGNKKAKMQKIVLITDTYTSLLPFTCMYDPDSETFLGDHYYFETMQSLLTMGIMNQLPEPMVELPADPQSMCIVGNPIIPKFYLNGEVWSLGKLPYARREAQWVGHILNTPPILDEQATKSAVVMRFMRAKVIHIATHGSSVSGFLAFASLTSTRQGEGVDSSGVLLHPEEVEKLSISPALVVLSSCDSSRGTVKADGVQGMARAFLLAGAQAVLTALWRVPDESAAVFMRFFYRFLENGFESSLSLQKAILSLRCFSKYSQYIHWSGYQLTGRSIRLDMKPSPVTTILESTLRPSSPFPRLMLVKKLESVLVDNPRLPTDIQILHGSPGVKPSEIAIDFIHSCHAKFAAGIFWISCRTPDIIDASLKSIEKTIDKPLNKLRLSDTQQALVVLDNAIELPSSGKLISFLKHTNVHIIILSKSADPLDSFVKEVDKALIRGCSIHEVKTLSTIDSTQRIVYEISKQYYLKANNNDQAIFEKLAEFTSGSPLIVDIAAQVLLKFVQENSDEPSEGLNQFADSIQLSKSRKVVHKSPLASSLQGVEDTCFQVREISDAFTHLVPNVASVSPNHTDVWESESEYDSWDSIGALIQRCVSTPGEMLLLQALSIFGCIPVPIPLVTTMSSLIAQSSGHSHLAGILHERLMEAKLILRYPQPVVLHSTYTKGDKASEEPLFLYLPQHLASQLWLCNDIDQVMAVTVAYKALQKVIDENSPKSPELLHFYLGLIPPLEEKTALLAVEKKHCYEAVYELYLQLSHQLTSTNHTHI